MISTTALRGLGCTLSEELAPAPNETVLGVVEYSDRVGGPISWDGYPWLAVPMAPAGGQPFAEIWQTAGKVVSGEYNGLAYGHDGEYLFCCGRVEETGDRVTATEHAYLAAFELLDVLGYRQLIRMWNLVDGINTVENDGRGVYSQFCHGRAIAFERRRMPAARLPAATAVGSRGGGGAFYFLASRTATVTTVENPRQSPAYRYPRQYGIKAPSFARAAYLSVGEPDGADHLFISGTGSILGSATAHTGYVELQTLTALENIATLISPANLDAHGIPAGFTLADLATAKVYVKRQADLDKVRQICSAKFADDAMVAYLNVDMCRPDLLVGIEGVISPVRPPA